MSLTQHNTLGHKRLLRPYNAGLTGADVRLLAGVRH